MSKQHNAYAGHHRFIAENGDRYGSFYVFYADRVDVREWNAAEDGSPYRAGWYWQAAFPGCLPDGEPSGPYTSSRRAWRAAQSGE